MPIALPTGARESAVVEQRPGDFKRHPSTGAPWVTHPTATKKRTGRKDELLAACEAAGIDVAAEANARGVKVTKPLLIELLGPDPKLVQYGRPSGLGKQIENTTNLQKWSERAVALGVTLQPDLTAEVAALDAAQQTLVDAEAKTMLDAVAVKAKNVARTGIAAERGTHTHALTEDVDEDRDWIERARTGEDLGIPVEAQRALVAAWEQMLERNGIEILATEANVVDDVWRQAGTLDRLAYLSRDLRFVVAGGEVVALPAGTVIVLDIKTGRLRCEASIVQHWLSYAVQIASYAQATPYDVDTGERSEWQWPVDQRWALIAHLDVLAAIEGEATCRLVLVDLEAGREAGERCAWARRWEKRTDVFSLVTDSDETCVVVPVSPPSQPVAEPEVDDFDTPVTLPSVTQPEDPPAVEESTLSTGSSTAALDRDEVRRVDDGGHSGYVERDALKQLVDRVAASPAKAWVNAWVSEAHAADVGWNPRPKPTVRRFEILRAAHHLAVLAERDDEAAVRLLIACVLDTDQAEHPTTPVGRWLADLTVPEAGRLADMAQHALDLDPEDLRGVA